MRLMNLESHFFSTQKLSINEQEINNFIQKFLPMQVYPQVFNETDMFGNNKQQFMFTNPLDGKQILFMDNKISFTKSFNENHNMDIEDLEKEHVTFSEFISNTLKEFESLRSTIMFNRLSYVVRFANLQGYDAELDFYNKSLIPTLGWGQVTKNPTDFGINLGYKNFIDEKEEINNLTRIFLGLFQNIGQHGVTSDPCFLKEVDINTIEDNKENRFSTETALQITLKLKEIAHDKVVSLSVKTSEK